MGWERKTEQILYDGLAFLRHCSTIRVYNGELEDNETNRPQIFNVLYSIIATYFKDLEIGAAIT